ncbi:hypothetical protein [Synechococcus sp. CCY 9618]|uniref:hypothetical protein n=1 Tax=Synechococcus sp. CCY 9618 TaxID=2815602 RepID=UPI001C244FF5|nr:hypothetical protein [Synechococcus sp. CCY 9618]
MAKEQGLLLLVAVLVVGIGTTTAVTRPGVWRLGQEGTPPAGSSVRYGGSYRAGRWVPATPGRQEWTGFQGRGPGSAK